MKNTTVKLLFFFTIVGVVCALFVAYVFWSITYIEEKEFNKIAWFNDVNKRHIFGRNIMESKML
jgi:hypothetical protein